jgi:WhiB family transcriptional regulator, redox-sensing transcriptional regulator
VTLLGEALMQPGGEIPTLLRLLPPRPSWMAEGACREPHEGVTFFPEHGESGKAAKAICAGCQGRAECLQHAVEHMSGACGVAPATESGSASGGLTGPLEGPCASPPPGARRGGPHNSAT